MDRYWLLTSTTYGTWLPGDPRGFVSNVRVDDGPEVRHNTPGTPVDSDMPALENAARQNMKGPAIYLIKEQAEAICAQFQETASYRGWELCAVAIMRNHWHAVVGVKGDPEPHTLLRDFKSYASRTLNRRWGKPSSETWWTESGSRRKLPNDPALQAAVVYVRDQPGALIVWLSDHWKTTIGERGA